MRVVESAFRSEVRAERRALTVAHPRVIVGLAAPVQLSDRGDPRSGGRQVRLIGGLRHSPAPYRAPSPSKFHEAAWHIKGPKSITVAGCDPITADRPDTSCTAWTMKWPDRPTKENPHAPTELQASAAAGRSRSRSLRRARGGGAGPGRECGPSRQVRRHGLSVALVDLRGRQHRRGGHAQPLPRLHQPGLRGLWPHLRQPHGLWPARLLWLATAGYLLVAFQGRPDLDLPHP